MLLAFRDTFFFFYQFINYQIFIELISLLGTIKTIKIRKEYRKSVIH